MQSPSIECNDSTAEHAEEVQLNDIMDGTGQVQQPDGSCYSGDAEEEKDERAFVTEMDP